MKKMFLTLVVCLVSSFGFAEVVTPAFSVNGETHYVPESYQPIKYIVIDKSEGQNIEIEYYNPANFSFVKQISFTIQETDYKYYPQVILDQFVLVIGYNENFSYEDNNRSNAKLYDETGKIIYDFGVANYYETSISQIWSKTYSVWQISSNKILLDMYKDNVVKIDEEGYATELESTEEFYYLTISEDESGIKSVSVEKKAAFPCPAREVVNIPISAERGHLHIRNTNGKIMKTQSVNGAEYQQVNTSNFPSGTYIYQTEAESGSFIVR